MGAERSDVVIIGAGLVGEIAADLACGGTVPDPRFTLAAQLA